MNMMVMVPEEEKVTTNYVQVDHETNTMFPYDRILKNYIQRHTRRILIYIKNFTIITYDRYY